MSPARVRDQKVGSGQLGLLLRSTVWQVPPEASPQKHSEPLRGG